MKWLLQLLANLMMCEASTQHCVMMLVNTLNNHPAVGKIFVTVYFQYLLLTKLVVGAVSYMHRPSCFLSIYGPSMKRVGHKLKGKNKDL